MSRTDPERIAPHPGRDAIAAALARVPVTGTAPVLLTLLDAPPESGGVLAQPEPTEPELWHSHGIPMVLHAFAEGLRRHSAVTGDGVAGYGLVLPAAGVAYVVDRAGAHHTVTLATTTVRSLPDPGVAAGAFTGLAEMVHAASGPGTRTHPRRQALLVGGEAALRAELTTAAPGLLTAGTAADAATAWRTASLVIVCADALEDCVDAALPARPFLIVLAPDGTDPWPAAARLGATHVAFLPTCRPWLAGRLAEHQPSPT